MVQRIFGHIANYPEGSWFTSRVELALSGVHTPRQAGISGGEQEGADSIVLSGGYEDDYDAGDLILYTGQGGRDPDTGQQNSDQVLKRGNRALAHSCMKGLPVRVIRGSQHNSPYSPSTGYRYDGLYRVEEYWRESGRSGFSIWRFRLVKIEQDENIKRISEDREIYNIVQRKKTTIQRIIRDTDKARSIKELYDYRCQVCGVRLEGSAGAYAEAAHIKPLGLPHNGPDVVENILCLCPNHHVLFDYGGFTIDDDFSLLGIGGNLIVHPLHKISKECLSYHRNHYYRSI